MSTHRPPKISAGTGTNSSPSWVTPTATLSALMITFQWPATGKSIRLLQSVHVRVTRSFTFPPRTASAGAPRFLRFSCTLLDLPGLSDYTESIGHLQRARLLPCLPTNKKGAAPCRTFRRSTIRQPALCLHFAILPRRIQHMFTSFHESENVC
jgi:hypothetical protein